MPGPLAGYSTDSTRYIHMQGTKRATTYGYSLHEFWLFGQPAT